MDVNSFENLEPIYEELPGWEGSTIGVRNLDDLPPNAKAYIEYIEKAVEVPVDIISTGADREDTIILRNPFDE
jgi:adenylosuccinate synthase